MPRKYATCAKNHNRIVELAAMGWSMSAIGRDIGTAHRHVSRYMKKHGIPALHRQVMENNPAWKGGRQIDKSGYVLILRKDHPHANNHGYVREHRLVMEGLIGRVLEPTEVVHHIDGNRGNNAPENLRLYSSNGAHLADDLKGRCPKWTPQGRENIRQSTILMNQLRKRTSNPRVTAEGGLPLPQRICRPKERRGTGLPLP